LVGGCLTLSPISQSQWPASSQNTRPSAYPALRVTKKAL
jgi:hypothetical protein